MVSGSPPLTSLQCSKFAGYDSVHGRTSELLHVRCEREEIRGSEHNIQEYIKFAAGYDYPTGLFNKTDDGLLRRCDLSERYFERGIDAGRILAERFLLLLPERSPG